MSATDKINPRQKDSPSIAVQSEALGLNEITNRGLANLLARSLAAYVLLRSKEPVCDVIQDIFEIENEAAALVKAFCVDQEKITSLRGTLVSVFSLVPIGRDQSVRDVTPKKAGALPSRKRRNKNSPSPRKKGE